MSSPEYEKFEMNEAEIEDLYDPTRKKFKQSKNKTIYGIWADSEDEDDGRETSRFAGGKRKNKDYSVPVNFVSGGIKVGDKISKVEDEEDDFVPDSDEEEERSQQKIKQKIKQKPMRSTKGYGSKPASGSSEVGCWEKHTKGIGQKLLEKMGHVAGRGLGKNLQGISTPIEAVQRKGRGAIGMYGKEKKVQPFQDEVNEGADDGEFKQNLRRWKKGEKEKISGKKYVTAEELLKSKASRSQNNKNSYSEMNPELAKVKVIDMTGKEQRILTGYQAISKRHNQPVEDDTSIHAAQPKLFNLPELFNNLELIIEMTEDSLIKNHRKLASEEDTLVNLEYELKKLKGAFDEEEDQISRLEEVIEIMNECREVCMNSALVEAMESCSEQLQRLRSNYQQEYLLYDLSLEIISIITPAVKREFRDWDPLLSPKQGTEVMIFIREILDGSSQTYHQGFGGMGSVPTQMEPFDNLLWEIIMPKIRTAIGQWNVKHPHYMLDILEYWHPILPQWMITNLLEQCIYMKLQIALDKWEPNKDHIPVQTWIQPWAAIMGDRMSILYSMIRQKLGKTLACWRPDDASARVIVSSWLGLFDQGHMDVFVVKHVLPKLVACLQSISFSMKEFKPDQWKWVMDWVDIIPHQHMVEAIKENFFPNFLRAISLWASSGNYSLVEMNHWFTSWLSLFPDRLKNDHVIKGFLSEAVMIINHGTRVHQPQQQRATSQFYGRSEPPTFMNRSSQQMNTKQKFEQLCYDRGVQLIPMMNKGQNEQQIYKLGQLLIYFEGNFIYYFENLRWLATTSFELIFNKAGIRT